MLQNKKILALASVLLLAGCSSTIEAKPSYDKENDFLLGGKLDGDKKTQDLTNNLRTAVWDALKNNGSINTAVVDQTLFTLAELELGAYDTLDAETKAKIDERMDDKLYDAIKTGAYDYRNKFDEESFVNKIKQSLPYTIDCGANPQYTKDFVILDDTRDHLYSGGSFADGTAYTADSKNNNKFALTCNYQTYKEQTYLPQVYREMLIEKYIVDNEYDTLGRSYARKIQYVGIKENSKHPGAASELVNTWVDIYLNDENDVKDADLDVLAKAWIGYNEDYTNKAEVKDLQIKAGLTNEAGDYNYTLYGDMLSDYSKINDDPLLTDSAIENAFTNNGAYLKETGKEIKTNEIRRTTVGDDGWFIKSTDLSSLPSALTSRLFDISTANEMNSNLNGIEEPTELPNSKFVKLIDGDYYLKPATFEPDMAEKNRDIIFYDSASQTYYIVLVEEAVNPKKLSKLDEDADDTAKAKVYTDEMREEAVYEIAKKYATRDTSKNKAMVHYLKEAGIIFHDQDIYDYFKSTYPDMFEDED